LRVPLPQATAADIKHHRSSNQNDERSEQAQRGNRQHLIAKQAKVIDEQAHQHLTNDWHDDGMHTADLREQQNIADDKSHP